MAPGGARLGRGDPPGPGPRIAGFIRLTHPFPTLLDGLATAAIALVAGGPPSVAIRLGLAMVGLQAGIGTVNDVVDQERDRGTKPGKPLPHGSVSLASARALAAIAIALGLALSSPSGLPTLAIALVGLVIGLTYDLRLKGTAWSWLPFALGIPLLPVYAWLGATGTLPSSFAILIPAGAAAGAALAIANAVADVERDRAAGSGSVAMSLGAARAWRVHLGLHAAVFALALGSLATGSDGGPLDRLVAVAVVVVGGALVALGAVQGRSPLAARRERGWELEAIGIGLAAVGWVGGSGAVG